MATLSAFRSTAFVALLLAGLPGEVSAFQSKPHPPTTRATPIFKDGQAQVVEAFRRRGDWIQHDLWVATEFDSDGNGKPDRVHVDVTRPRQTETEGLKVPVVYESSPYYSGTATGNRRYFWNPKQAVGAVPPKRPHPPQIRARTHRPLMSRSLVRTWVSRGFAVVHSASPGTGLSDGCPTIGGSNEALAPKAVIDWLNGRVAGYTTRTGKETVQASWCTGKVGMIGTSYNGTLALAAATTGVRGLEAIVPVSPNTSYYHYYRSNGLVRHPGGWTGEDVDVLFDFIDSGDPQRRKYCECEVRDKVLAKHFDRTTGDYNAFWASRNYRTHLGSVKAATLLAHGLNDWNVMPDHSIAVYEELKRRGVPAQIFLHQGGHGGPPPFSLMNRWFTHYLYGVQNGVEKDPHAWIVRVGDSDVTGYADYPNPASAMVRLSLGKGGTGVGKLLALGRAASRPSQAKESLTDDVALTGAQLAMAESLPHRLLYGTPELERPLHISGRPRLRIRLASSAPAANLSVWLVSLPWTEGGRITDNVITRGWADPQNHASLSKGEPLVPGKFYDMQFDLQPDDQIVPAGARIGLMIFSSDRQFTLWPPAGTKLTVDLDATSLDVPVVGGRRAFVGATGGR